MECPNNITGLVVDEGCPTIEIKEIACINFYLKFMQELATRIENAIEGVSVSLFNHKDVPSLGVLITPQGISDFVQTTTLKTFLFQLSVVTANTDTLKAYGQVLGVAMVVANALDDMRKAKQLTITTRMSIINSNEIVLSLTATKTI